MGQGFSYKSRSAHSLLPVLVSLNIQNRIKDSTEDVHRSAFVVAILVAAGVTVLIHAVRAVLVAALETLLEVILILPAVNAVRVAIGSGSIDAVV